MAIRINERTKTTQRTWLSIPGEDWQYHLDSRRDGKRVEVLRWHADNPNAKWGDGTTRSYKAGDVNIRIVTGDAWRKPESFILHGEVTMPGATDSEVLDWIREQAG